MVTLQSRVRIPADVLFRDLGGEAVILNTATGTYYGLDETGTRMWALLAQLGQIQPAYQALLAEYDVTEDCLQRDLLNFVDTLASHGLVEVHEV